MMRKVDIALPTGLLNNTGIALSPQDDTVRHRGTKLHPGSGDADIHQMSNTTMDNRKAAVGSLPFRFVELFAGIGGMRFRQGGGG